MKAFAGHFRLPAFFLFILFLGIIFGVYAIKYPKLFKSKAHEFGEIKLVNPNGQVLDTNTTTTPQILLQIETPNWSEISQSLIINFVKKAYAQENSCTYFEEPQNCPNGGTRKCQGTDEGNGCHYNQEVEEAFLKLFITPN